MRAAPWWTSGCAFDHVRPPVVEYRVCPIATSPGSAEAFLVEHLGTSPISRSAVTRPPSETGDTRRLLSAVLEREEAEVRQPRDVALVGADAEHAAHQPAPRVGKGELGECHAEKLPAADRPDSAHVDLGAGRVGLDLSGDTATITWPPTSPKS